MSKEESGNHGVTNIKDYIKPPTEKKDDTVLYFSMVVSGAIEDRDALDSLVEDMRDYGLHVPVVMIEKDGVASNINYEADNDVS